MSQTLLAGCDDRVSRRQPVVVDLRLDPIGHHDRVVHQQPKGDDQRRQGDLVDAVGVELEMKAKK